MAGAPDALYPAVAAVLVALIGLAGNWILSRRHRGDDAAEDTNIVTALAAALAKEQEARERAERRAAIAEARLTALEETPDA